ncbi:UNKNOWN [Stylonychia lemnae]|uniref:Uncharacterized protein n=1 Tax=Stylonychia lemnae TaxID=5949 RepID=A0A078BDQ8_STYLE|nr:UNKNOWN [Stylonychia lemnae]|eukprot:CDW91312.1 UNKNOWN [Stylonychia lemnae]
MDIIQKILKKKKPLLKRKNNKDSRTVEPYPKKTVSVLLNSEMLRDLRVFIIFDGNYEVIRYIDIIIKKSTRSPSELRQAKDFITQHPLVYDHGLGGQDDIEDFHSSHVQKGIGRVSFKLGKELNNIEIQEQVQKVTQPGNHTVSNKNLDPTNIVQMWQQKQDNDQEEAKKKINFRKASVDESIDFIQRKMYTKDLNHYFPNHMELIDVANQIFYGENPQEVNQSVDRNSKQATENQKSSTPLSKKGFKYLYSFNGEQLRFGFDEIGCLDDFVFLVDQSTFTSNNLKLLHFISDFQQFLKTNNQTVHNEILNQSILKQAQKDQLESKPKPPKSKTIFRKLTIQSRSKDNQVIINNGIVVQNKDQNNNNNKSKKTNSILRIETNKQSRNEQDDKILFSVSQVFQDDPEKKKCNSQKAAQMLLSKPDHSVQCQLYLICHLHQTKIQAFREEQVQDFIIIYYQLFKQVQAGQSDSLQRDTIALDRTKNIMNKVKQRMESQGLNTERQSKTQSGFGLQNTSTISRRNSPTKLKIDLKYRDQLSKNQVKNFDLQTSIEFFQKYYISDHFEQRISTLLNKKSYRDGNLTVRERNNKNVFFSRRSSVQALHQQPTTNAPQNMPIIMIPTSLQAQYGKDEQKHQQYMHQIQSPDRGSSQLKQFETLTSPSRNPNKDLEENSFVKFVEDSTNRQNGHPLIRQTSQNQRSFQVLSRNFPDRQQHAKSSTKQYIVGQDRIINEMKILESSGIVEDDDKEFKSIYQNILYKVQSSHDKL